MDFKNKNELPTNEALIHNELITSSSTKKDSANKNDSDLIEELSLKYSTDIYSKCITLFNNESIAREAVPYVLLKAYVQLNKTAISNEAQLINQLTYGLCISVVQKAKIKKASVFSKPISNSDDSVDILLENKILELEVKQLKEILNQIPIGDKAVLMMRYQDKMSIEQIANVLETNAKEVKVKLINATYTAMELKSNLEVVEEATH